MYVSINGGAPQQARSVVVFRDEVPVAACSSVGTTVIYADAVRDPEFPALLATIGVSPKVLPVLGPTIRGKMP